MQKARRGRTSWAIAGSIVAHVAVLTLALLQRPTLPLPTTGPAGPPQPIIPVLLLPRAPASPSPGHGGPRPSALRLHRRPIRGPEGPLPVAPLPAPEPAQAAVEARPQASAAPGPSAAAAPGAAAPDLRAGLRHGAAGCANAGAVGMSRAERERCDEEFANRTAGSPFLPAAIPSRMRAYYDAVAEAKKPDPPLAPPRARAGMGMFEPEPVVTNGHGPAVGCKVHFGPGKVRNTPPHALTLGPCYIEPPKGSLTPEVDLTPP